MLTSPGVTEEPKKADQKTPWRNQMKKQKTKKIKRSRKVKRSKKIKNKLLYVNIRGIKSKRRSLHEIVKEENPTMIAIAETLMEEKEDIKIEGYKVLPKNKKDKGRGLLIAIREELEHITSIVMEDDDPAEQLWIKISNERINIRIGLVYAPQESRTKLQELKLMYKKIEEQIQIARTQKQKTLLVGDFNCKVGKIIKGNTDTVSKGGKLLLKLAEKTNMEMLNSTEICKGLWTWNENGKTSVIDYVLVNKDEIKAVEEMIIDETKEITPYTENQNKKVYTYHNAIIVKLNWVATSLKKQSNTTSITQKAKEELKIKTTKSKLSKIWKEGGTVQQKYTKWNEQVKEITREIFTGKNKNRRRNCKTLNQLRKRRKQLKVWRQDTTDINEKEILGKRRELLLQFINEVKQTQEKTKIIKIANKIKTEGGFDANAFWKHDEMMKGKKKEIATAMRNEEGNIEEEPTKIKEIYRNFYQQLLKDRDPEDDDEKQIQQDKEKCIEIMERYAQKKQIEPITKEEYQKMKGQLKKKKAPDKQEWRYEWVQWAGPDLETSILEMMNQVLKEKAIPKEWKDMTIKSISKKANKRMEMEYKRGLFLTNILSKCMERILLNRRQNIIEKSMQPFQCGGVRRRSTVDNLFILNSVIAEFKKEKKDLYILFGDLEKCFDKLYLKDCIIELERAGVPTEEAIFVYYMNKDITAEVDTPHGKTEAFEIEEAVRQGTIFGTTMCGTSTNQINKMGKPEYTLLHQRFQIMSPIFVDDIAAMGETGQIEMVGRKMNALESTKKFQFNNKEDKTDNMIIKNSNKEEEKAVNIDIRKGKVGKTNTYKYLGDHYDQSGTNEVKIKKKMEKSKYMALEVKRTGCFANVGRADMMVRMLLLESIIKPSLLANVETWHNITPSEEAIITKHHHKLLCIIFEQKQTTPYYGIIGETGIWPYVHVIVYKKLMFMHLLIHSDDSRLAKQIVEFEQQQKLQGTWHSELKLKADELNIDISINHVKSNTKSEWKRMVKKKIQTKINAELHEQAEQKTKLRFLKGKTFQCEEYLKVATAAQCRKIMQIRLNMIEVKSNYKNQHQNTTCVGCHQQAETTEHLFQCWKYRELGVHRLTLNKNSEELKSTTWLIEAANAIERLLEIRNKRLEMDQLCQ